MDETGEEEEGRRMITARMLRLTGWVEEAEVAAGVVPALELEGCVRVGRRWRGV